MSSGKSNKGPELDPYDLLGVEQDAPDAVITKAYRKLALKLHPDKQQGKSADEIEKISKKFHDVKEARSFLLDPENKEARRLYDAKRSSQKLRKQAEMQREKTMNESRKRMREQLHQQEELAKANKQRRKMSKSSKAYDKDLMDKLRREGNEMRQAYADRTAAENAKKEAQKRKEESEQLKFRQVRLKWSRKRIGESPSEHSLACMLSKEFGDVEQVEMLGSKGNAALITFSSPSSCAPCVECYKDSDKMRATFIIEREDDNAEIQQEDSGMDTMNYQKDKENLHDRKARQEAERERLIREMEQEEDGGSAVSENKYQKYEAQKSDYRNQKSSSSARQYEYNGFADIFPKSEEYRKLTSPMEKLQKAEEHILGSILSPESMTRLRYTTMP